MITVTLIRYSQWKDCNNIDKMIRYSQWNDYNYIVLEKNMKFCIVRA